MPANEEALQLLFVEVRVKTQKLEADFERAVKYGEKQAQTLEDAYKRTKLDFDTKFAKMRINELSALQKKLQAELQKKISLNVSVLSLQSTKEKLDRVNSAMNMINPKPVGEGLSKWAMIMTGVNQSFELVRNTFSGLKNLISESVKSATGLEVLRANFKGTAEEMELFQKAVAGTMSESSLISLSNWATDLGISMKDQAIAFSFAEDAVDKHGGMIEEHFQKIINASEGMGRGLKAVGVQTKVYQKNLEELEKAQGQKLATMDADEQKTLMTKAVIMSLGITIEDVKNKVKDNADKFQSLSVDVEKAKIKLGNLIKEGLLPLIDAFDSSGKHSKDVVSAIIGIGGIALQTLPMLVNLRVAQALLGKQALTTAGEMDVLTGSTVKASGAVKMFFTSFAAAGIIVGAIKLIGDEMDKIAFKGGKNFWEKQREQIEATKKAIEELNKINITPAQRENFTKGFYPLGVTEPTPQLDSTKISSEVDKIKAKIKELTDANEKAGISLEQLHKNQSKINELQKQLTPEIIKQLTLEEQKTKLVDDSIKKIETELKLADLLKTSKLELLNKSKENLDIISKGNLTDEQRVKILEEQKKLQKEIRDIEISARVKKGKEDFSDLQPVGLQKIPKGHEGDTDKQKEQREKDELNLEQFLSEKRIALIQNEYEQRKAEIIQTAKEEMELYGTNAEAKDKIEKFRDLALRKLEQERIFAGLQNLASLGDKIVNTFSIAGHTLVGQLNQALNLINSIAEIAKTISIASEGGGIFGFLGSLLGFGAKLLAAPATGGASMALHKGGTVVNSGGRISVGPGFASGTDFVVPKGFPGDSYPIRVESGERVTVTPANKVAETMGGFKSDVGMMIVNAIKAMNMNLIQKSNPKITVINKSRDIRTVVLDQNKVQDRMLREGKNLNEA